MLEVYSLLFVDSLVAALILPLNGVLIFKIMSYFGGYSYLLMVLVATVGAMLGCVVNWILGRLIIFARIEYHKTLDSYGGLDFYIKLILMLLILVCSWAPIWGGIINVLSGYFKVKVLHLAMLGFFSYLCYFTYCIVTL
ncbi:MAG: DedA family protein [Ehrlichia sp.]